jgi:hypothetical protein
MTGRSRLRPSDYAVTSRGLGLRGWPVPATGGDEGMANFTVTPSPPHYLVSYDAELIGKAGKNTCKSAT